MCREKRGDVNFLREGYLVHAAFDANFAASAGAARREKTMNPHPRGHDPSLKTKSTKSRSVCWAAQKWGGTQDDKKVHETAPGSRFSLSFRRPIPNQIFRPLLARRLPRDPSQKNDGSAFWRPPSLVNLRSRGRHPRQKTRFSARGSHALPLALPLPEPRDANVFRKALTKILRKINAVKI